MTFQLLVIAVSLSTASSPNEDAHLNGIRNLAKGMLQAKPSSTDSSYCEYTTTSQVEGCSGPSRNAVRHRILRSGAIETWEYRSWGEGGDPVGYYRGRITGKQWQELLQTLAAMRWVEEIGLSGPRPPPSPTESIAILRLSDGKSKAEYQKAGPAPGPIDDAFVRPMILAQQSGQDTIWQLALVNPEVVIRKDSIHLTARWRWRGPMGARVLFSSSAGGDLCGTASFKWFLKTSSQPVKWHRETMNSNKGRTISWDVPSKENLLRLAFPFRSPVAKGKRIGILEGIGVRLILGESRDTISVTASTNRIEF